MNKLVVSLLVAALAVSCSKKEDPTNTAVAEHTAMTENRPVQQNEMIAEMEDMMEEMHSNAITGNNDADFSRMMKEHHEGAVDMSELLLEKGKDEELKSFARKVIETQNKEIHLMKKYEDRKDASADSKEFVQALNQSMSSMMDKNIPVHNDIDKDYAQQMIPHHKSAVDMAKVYLKFGKEKELLQLSEDIVKTQNAEITQLKDWLNKN